MLVCTLLLALCVGAGSLACSADARYRILSVVFDGVPPPGTEAPPRRRRARRAPPPEVRPAPAVAVVARYAGPTYTAFEQLQEHFPKDRMGNVDWVAAASAGLLKPRPGIDPATPDITPMPLDVHLDPGIPMMRVTFPHEAHTYWLRCDNCHPAIFEMRAGAAPITMQSIFQGEHCGRCHGKVAFAPATGCPRCHLQLGGGGP